ncbi:MAG: branched-chain amino acid aminotransferase [Clostridia bacterium]|nr:branched-chain amino acid aminotransferase [Clostridia bacterium]
MFQTEYERKRTTAPDEAARIRSGDTVYLAGGSLTPLDFAAAMGHLSDKVEDVRVLNYLPLKPLTILTDPAASKPFQFESVFYNRAQQRSEALGRCSFIPTHLRNASRDWGAAVPEYDAMVFTVSPMDKYGYFTLAGAAIMELELVHRARRVVVEVASRAPRVFGDVLLHISQVDAVIESDRFPATLPQESPDETDRTLGKVVAELVEDGATVQLGFGGTIDALAAELQTKRGLGIHTEAFSDAAMALLTCGAADNRRKSIDPGYTVTSFSMGSEALYTYLDDNPSFRHRLLSYTNAPSVLAAQRGMTSINAALQIDLTGQCASESLGSLQISGTGGQVDTVVGAQMAEGGKSIITLRSTYASLDSLTGETKLQSRILPTLPLGAAVTLPRADTHFVATEYGAVCLRGLSLKERAKALISIAHPRFRDWLSEESRRLGRF